MKVIEQRVIVDGVDLKEGGNCVYRAVATQQIKNLDITFGTIFVWDRNVNSFDSVYPFHVWNVDENENIHDDVNQIYKHATSMDFKCSNPNTWNVKMIDGFDFKVDGSYLRHAKKMIKHLNKQYKGKFDAVYVEGLAFDNDHATKQDWDSIEKMIQEVESQMVQVS